MDEKCGIGLTSLGMSVGGTAIQSYGGAKNQALLNEHFKTGKMPFGGKMVPGEDLVLSKSSADAG